MKALRLVNGHNSQLSWLNLTNAMKMQTILEVKMLWKKSGQARERTSKAKQTLSQIFIYL